MKSEYILDWFEAVIPETLGPEKMLLLDEGEFQEFQQRIKSETGKVRSHLMHQVFSLRNMYALELLIQQYQTSLIRLLDHLERITKAYPAWPSAKHDPFPDVAAALQELLQFIETYFTKYFDLDQKVPDSYLGTNQKKWKQDWQKKALQLKNQVPEELYILLSTVLLSLLSSSEQSYRKMIYTKELVNVIGNEIQNTANEGGLFPPLLSNLIYLNLNHSGMVSYAIRQMQKELEQGINDEEKSDILNQYKIAIQENPIKPGVAYSETLPSFSTSLIRWIEYQHRKLRSDFLNTETQAPMEKHPIAKVNLSVSVAMFGLFIRLLREEGIVTNRNQAEMVRFFADHFATLKQPEISAESLYGSYFKPQPGTIRMMQECLLRLQAVLHKKF